MINTRPIQSKIRTTPLPPFNSPRVIPPKDIQSRIISDPGWFMRDILGAKPWSKQEEICKSIFMHQRVAVSGCTGSSKSNAAGMAALAWLIAFGPEARVFTTAPSFRQVDTNLWAEIKRFYRNARINLGGRCYDTAEIKFGNDWYAMGFSTKDTSMVHGIHGKNDLVIVDDAHGIDMKLYDELENMMGGGNTHMLLLYNKLAVTGPTYDCNHKDKSLWCNIAIPFSETPNAKAPEESPVIPSMLLKKSVGVWKTKYKEDSNFYRVKVLDEYPTAAKDSLIPMDWIEQAMRRVVPQDKDARLIVGTDVAWEGDDNTVHASCNGRQFHPLEVYHGADPMKVADQLDVHLIKPGAIGYVDAIGIGAGVYSREAQRKRDVNAVVVSEDAVGKWEGKDAKEHFKNLRAQIAWMLREAMNPDNPEAIALPYDLELMAEMSAIRYFTDEKNGKIRIQLKKEMKKELGYSPDRFDAIAMANWGRYLLGAQSAVSDWLKEQQAVQANIAGDSAALRGLDLEGESLSVAIANGNGKRTDEVAMASAGGESMTLTGLGSFNE